MTNPDNIITLLQDEIVFLRAYIARLEALLYEEIPRTSSTPQPPSIDLPPPPPLQRQTGTYVPQ